MSVGVIVLAAGASQRMGQPKALLHLEGRSLLQWIVEQARALPAQEIVVTLAAPHGPQVSKELDYLRSKLGADGLHEAWNPAPERGMLSSVQCGLSLISLLAAQLSGALIWPVDLPRVQRATLCQILDVAVSQPGLIVPTYCGRGGHPLWLPRALFAEALALPAEQGLRALRERHPPCFVPVEDEEILRDLDTPEDWRRAH